MNINETHDKSLRCWVESANHSGIDFPIQNLPFAMFRLCDSDQEFRGGIAIGDQVLDLGLLGELNPFDNEPSTNCYSYVAARTLIALWRAVLKPGRRCGWQYPEHYAKAQGFRASLSPAWFRRR